MQVSIQFHVVVNLHVFTPSYCLGQKIPPPTNTRQPRSHKAIFATATLSSESVVIVTEISFRFGDSQQGCDVRQREPPPLYEVGHGSLPMPCSADHNKGCRNTQPPTGIVPPKCPSGRSLCLKGYEVKAHNGGLSLLDSSQRLRSMISRSSYMDRPPH